MRPDCLDRRQLNRATLSRQLLLKRTSMPTLDAVEHLVGLQSQAPLAHYVALWSRQESFDPVAAHRAKAVAAGQNLHVGLPGLSGDRS